MTLYKYSQTELNQAKNMRLHLVVYTNHKGKDENDQAEILTPEVYLSEKRAEDRADRVNKNDGKVKAAMCPLRLDAVDREGTDAIKILYLVMFLSQPEDAEDSALMTPECFMTKKEAKRRVRDTQTDSKKDIEGKYFPLKCYAHGVNLQNGAVGRAG
jgi:hypothetical protein